MLYFGNRYDAPVYDDAQEVPTPVGGTCLYCGEMIVPGDDGWLYPTIKLRGSKEPDTEPIHAECQLRMMFGSVGHQRGLCTCGGGPGTMDDPPGMTLREGARAAVVEMAVDLP